MLMLQFIVDDVISATSFTTARHDNIEEDPPMQNAIKYDAKRIKKGRAAAGRVANGTEAASTTEATSTSTARQPPPTKRGRKPKVVPYVKRIRLDKEEKERVTAALSAARTAARAKLRDNSPAEQVSISDDIAKIPTGRNIAKIPTGRKKSKTNPKCGTQLNQLKPVCGVKTIEKYVAEPACCFEKLCRKSPWQELQDSKAKAFRDNLCLRQEMEVLTKEKVRNMAEIAALNR